MNKNLKAKIKSNKVTIGTWITIGHHSIVEILSSAKFDWFAIDMEHSPISYNKAQELIVAADSKNIPVLIRVEKNNEMSIKKAMDCGAAGVIVPMVCNSEDAKKAVNYTKYPLSGKRGVGLARAQNYGIGFEEYHEWLDEHSVIIVQIEHINAVKNLNSIISIDGIDGCIIGPYDLSASMGIPGDFNSKKLNETVKLIEKECLKNKFPIGFHVIKPDSALVFEKIDKGYSFIGFSLDFLFLGEKSRFEMKELSNVKK